MEAAVRGRLRAMTCPGTPTTTESGGTSRTTTALAPMRLPEPIVTGPEHLGAGADRHPVTDGRVALARLQAGASQGHTLVDGDVDTDFRGLTDDHAEGVVDEETRADDGAGWMSTEVQARTTVDRTRPAR